MSWPAADRAPIVENGLGDHDVRTAIAAAECGVHRRAGFHRASAERWDQLRTDRLIGGPDELARYSVGRFIELAGAHWHWMLQLYGDARRAHRQRRARASRRSHCSPNQGANPGVAIFPSVAEMH